MLVKEVFKQLYKYSNSKQNPVWKLECDCQKSLVLQYVEDMLQNEIVELFKTYKISEKVIPIIHLHLNELIDWQKRSHFIEHKEVFSFLQFTCGIVTTSQLNFLGEFAYCYDIFMKSIFDKVYNGEEHDISKTFPCNYQKARNNYIANSSDLVEQWLSQLFYYSKSFSGLNEWCKYFFDELLYDLREHLEIEVYHPQLLSNLLSWCSVNSDTKGEQAIRSIIQREFDKINWSNNQENNEVKSLLGLQLLLCKNYKNGEKEKLFNELENSFGFNPLARMQATIALCVDEDKLIKNLDLLLISITEYNQFLDTQNLNRIDYIYQKARIFKNILNDIICFASDLGKNEIIDKVLLSYYDIKKPQEIGTTLFIIPNQDKRIDYCFENKVIIDEKDTQKILIEIVDIENRAFSTSRMLKGGIKQKFEDTGKPTGYPESNMANDYEVKLLELYNFRKIEAGLENLKSLCQFDFNSFPLQALMAKTINRTLPINLSLSKKTNFKKVENVLFWAGDSHTTEIEKDALKEVFNKANIVFEIHDEVSSSLSNFEKRINGSDPDVIWISSHGEFKHYEPNVSSIRLSDTESITIRDFELLVNKGDKRRLLFLNICEGGTHAQTGEFKNLGFPNLLTTYNQDIISHLWMAEARFSYVFGVFIALGIANLGMNYFEAFEYSLLQVLSSKEQIIAEINSFDLDLTDLKERIQNNEGTEWGNLITTGSPVYNI